jgi:hypothetical protein
MAQTLDSQEGQGAGALEPVRQDFRPVRRAVRERWPITDQIRQLVVDEAARIVQTGRTPALQLAAAKVLLAADLVNARREANPDEERIQEARAHADRLREALSNPEARELLARLAEIQCNPPDASTGNVVSRVGRAPGQGLAAACSAS